MEDWKKEISQYDDRIEKIKFWCPDISSLIDKIPKIPLDYTPSKEGLVSIRVAIFGINGCIIPTHFTIATLINLLENGLLVTMSLPIRLTYEIWGASRYAHEEILLRMLNTKNVHKALERTDKLITGSRSEVNLPWGGKSDKQSIHVNDFIRALIDVHPQANGDYDFLCESCHPSFLMTTYWSMMGGPIIHNWSNQNFHNHAHQLIDRSLQCMEYALNGISREVEEILKLAILHIDKDKSHRAKNAN